MELAGKILSLSVENGHVGVVFLGQAGFVVKSSNGSLLAIDPYLSNCCERYFGFKRLMPQLLLPGQVEFDYIVTSHAHFDHFDVDSVPFMLANGRTKLITAADGVEQCVRLGIPSEKYRVLRVGDELTVGDFTLRGVACDHGELAPDALGLYITCGGKKLYFAGDTCYRQNIAQEISHFCVDFAAAPINGAFGNMNAEEAADFLKIVNPKLCVPCHYWNFAQHLGDPDAFIRAMQAPDAPAYCMMYPGEMIVI